MKIKREVMASLSIDHPFEPDLGFLYGTILVGKAHDPRIGYNRVLYSIACSRKYQDK